MNTRRFPPPWRADRIPGGYVVRDDNGQELAYIYAGANEAEARQAKVLTADEARRIVRLHALDNLVLNAAPSSSWPGGSTSRSTARSRSPGARLCCRNATHERQVRREPAGAI
jgi:hypothetical protein